MLLALPFRCRYKITGALRLGLARAGTLSRSAYYETIEEQFSASTAVSIRAGP